MYDTIIVGAGFAGLSAAHELRRGGQKKLLVLEARDRVGGRTKHDTVGGLDVDLGGMWLGPTQTRLKEMAEYYQVQTFATPMQGRNICRLRGREHSGEGEELDGLFGLFEGLDFLALQRRLDRVMQGIDCEAPWDCADAGRLDAMTVDNWLRDNARTQRARAMMRYLCASMFFAEATQISMLFFAHYIKSGGGLEAMMSAQEGGAQNLLFHGGVHQIARKMGEELGDSLHLSEPVSAVHWDQGGKGGVTVTTAQGSHQARRAILAVPPALLLSIDFAPVLPSEKLTLHRRLTMGAAIKFWVVYQSPFWREQGFNGLIARDDAPCTPIFDASPPGQPKGVLSGFFDGDHSVHCGHLGPDGRRELVLGVLAEHFGQQASKPLDYRDKDWNRSRWSGGAPGAYAPPGFYAQLGPWLRKPIGPLHWAGTETSPRWTGYIDGAIRSGERAAQEVLAAGG